MVLSDKFLIVLAGLLCLAIELRGDVKNIIFSIQISNTCLFLYLSNVELFGCVLFLACLDMACWASWIIPYWAISTWAAFCFKDC